MDRDLIERIAAALDRLAPAPAVPADGSAPAYVWHAGALRAARFAPLPLDLLTGIDAQRDAVVENGRRLAQGHAAHDILLWGVRGGGKSALVKSSIAAIQAEGLDLTLVEVGAADLAALPDVFAIVEGWSNPAIVFVDDLAFEGGTDAARSLRSMLEGGASGRPPNIRLYVTSNRRHIVARDMAEQDSAINVRDVVDDRLALADRFGLSLGFHACDQDTYLAMIANYAARFDLPYDEADALKWSVQRGARSGRVAWHYTVELAGREGRTLQPSA